MWLLLYYYARLTVNKKITVNSKTSERTIIVWASNQNFTLDYENNCVKQVFFTSFIPVELFKYTGWQTKATTIVIDSLE